MHPITQRLVSGRATRVSPLPSSPEKPSFTLLGASSGFLARFLALGLTRTGTIRASVAPRTLQLPGRARRVVNPGSAEAAQARKDGLVPTVVADLDKAPAEGSVIDLTPLAAFATASLSEQPPARRHEDFMAALATWRHPDGGEAPVLTVLELPTGLSAVRRRLSSVSHLESPADHVLFALLEEPEAFTKVVADPTLFLLVSTDGRFVTRLDGSDKRTAGKARLLAVLEAVEKLYANANLTTAEEELVGASPAAAEEAEALATALGASDTVVEPDRRLTAEEQRREERMATLRQAQDKVVFVTRSGAKATLADLTAPAPTPKVVSKRAPGEFLDKAIAEPTFDAITLSYLESGTYDRDMAAVLTSLSTDPSAPLFVERIERADSSDALTYKETVTVQFRDARGKSVTVRFDLPVVSRDGYMLIEGVKYSVTKQILAKPIIKVRPGEVLVTTAYNKATVERFGQNASPRSVYVRQLASWLDKNRPRGIRVELSSASAANAKYQSTLEYNDIARSVRSLRTADAAFVFSRPALDEDLAKVAPWFETGDSAEGGHPFGWAEGGNAVYFARADGSVAVYRKGGKGLTESDADLGETIHRAMVRAGASDAPAPSTASRKYVYSRTKILSQYLPTAVVVGYTLGLVPMLRRAGVDFKLVDKGAFRRSAHPGMDAVSFQDAVLVFRAARLRDILLINGLKELETDERPLADFGPAGMAWVDHIADRLGSPGHAKGLVNYEVSFIDPMTRSILAEMGLPTDFAGVLLHASALLEDNRHDEPNDMRSYRLRGPELINTLLYKALHREMETVRRTRESATPQRLQLNPNEILRQVAQSSNVEEVTELNPLLEVELRGKATWTGAAGGLGDGRTVTRAMRAFHPSMHGVFGFYSPDSSEIGVKRTLAFSAGVTDTRGTIDTTLAKSSAARVLAMGELISPFTAQHADPPKFWASV